MFCTVLLGCSLLFNLLIVGVKALSSSSPPKDIIRVYDSVLPQPSCQVLHEAASQSGLGHKVFQRPLRSQSKNISIIERALDSILTEMGDIADDNDDVQYVEYWTRQEWRHIEAHADVDEHLAKEEDALGNKDNPFRYPKNGHVMYLKVGSEVRGPTCVFPNLKAGGELLKQKERQDQNECNTRNSVELVTVPAVEGRLLRFEGSSLHAVPRPADLWFLSFVKGSPAYTPEGMWGRTVILFNTWTSTPPKDVPSFDHAKDGDVAKVDIDTMKGFVNAREAWEDIFHLQRPREGEEQVCDAAAGGQPYHGEKYGPMSTAKIWLLGNARRREYAMRTISMKANGSVKDALLESSRVSHVLLEH